MFEHGLYQSHMCRPQKHVTNIQELINTRLQAPTHRFGPLIVQHQCCAQYEDTCIHITRVQGPVHMQKQQVNSEEHVLVATELQVNKDALEGRPNTQSRICEASMQPQTRHSVSVEQREKTTSFSSEHSSHLQHAASAQRVCVLHVLQGGNKNPASLGSYHSQINTVNECAEKTTGARPKGPNVHRSRSWSGNLCIYEDVCTALSDA